MKKKGLLWKEFKVLWMKEIVSISKNNYHNNNNNAVEQKL